MRQNNPLSSVVLLAIAAVASGCVSHTFFWDVPINNALPTDQYNQSNPDSPSANGVPADVAPETMCALVREGAYGHVRNEMNGGVALAIIGGLLTASSTALAASASTVEQDPKKEAAWAGGWAGAAGLGAALVASGVYLIVKSGQDRQEYWVANAAVARIKADYAQYPVMTSAELKSDYRAWNAAAVAADVATATAVLDFIAGKAALAPAQLPPEAQRAQDQWVAAHRTRQGVDRAYQDLLLEVSAVPGFLAVLGPWRLDAEKANAAESTAGTMYAHFQESVRVERGWQTTTAGHATAVDRAAISKKIAAEAQALATARQGLVALRTTAVTAALNSLTSSESAYQSAVTALNKALAAAGGAGLPEAKVALVDAAAKRKVAHALLNESIAAQEHAQNLANHAQVLAAQLQSDATDAMNVMTGQQVAWGDCANALQSIAASDSVANTNFAGALSVSAGAAKASGGH
jgi:hypothetical protein